MFMGSFFLIFGAFKLVNLKKFAEAYKMYDLLAKRYQFYVLMGDIAIQGDILQGWWLGFVHGVGRATPLVFLTILGMLGVNAVGGLASKTAIVSKVTGIALVLLGAVIFISGAAHNWYETTFIHDGVNEIVELVAGERVAEHGHEPEIPEEHGHEKKPHEHELDDIIPSPWPGWVLFLMAFLPLGWYSYKEKSKS